MRRPVVLYLGGAAVLAALGGLLWANVTPIASYTVLEGLAASISERSQATIVAASGEASITKLQRTSMNTPAATIVAA